MTPGRGGARPGAGAKPADYEPSEARVLYEDEKALHEKVKRQRAELALEVEAGRYLPREAQRAAAATALSVLTQTLRSIPDNLELQFSLAPEVVERFAEHIDSALDEAAKAFKAMTNG